MVNSRLRDDSTIQKVFTIQLNIYEQVGKKWDP